MSGVEASEAQMSGEARLRSLAAASSSRRLTSMFPTDMALKRCASLLCGERLLTLAEPERNFSRSPVHISRARGVSAKEDRRRSFPVGWEEEGVGGGGLGEDGPPSFGSALVSAPASIRSVGRF